MYKYLFDNISLKMMKMFLISNFLLLSRIALFSSTPSFSFFTADPQSSFSLHFPHSFKITYARVSFPKCTLCIRRFEMHGCRVSRESHESERCNFGCRYDFNSTLRTTTNRSLTADGSMTEATCGYKRE